MADKKHVIDAADFNRELKASGCFEQTTPAQIDAAILAFCKRLEPAEIPYYVDVNPQPHCRLYDCIKNVSGQIKRYNGQQQQGWCIWYIPDEYIEAEYHCIWIDSEGKPVDITPKMDAETRILFLPSNKKAYRPNERLPFNYRKALVDNLENRHRLLNGRENDALTIKYYDPKIGATKMPMNEKIKALARAESAAPTFKPKLLEF